MPLTEEQWRQFRHAQEEAERLTSVQSQEAKDLEQRIKAHQKQKAMADMDRREADLRLRRLKQKVEALTSALNVKQQARESQQKELERVTKELEGMAEGQKSRGSARKKLEDERQEIMEDLSIEVASRRFLRPHHIRLCLQEIQNITATEQQIEKERRLTEVCQDLAQVVPGVSGRVVNLCQHVQKKYRVAVNVALGGHMDAVVTDTIQHARQCSQERMLSPLTFLPLDNLRASMDVRLQEALRGQVAIRPALSCVSFEPRLNRAFEFMLSDVVIADSLDAGRRFVFEKLKDLGIKCRVVTLNGETISRDGNLAVSSDAAKKGATRFDFSELEATKGRLEAIDSELIELRSKHSLDAAYAALQDAAKSAELAVRDTELDVKRTESDLEAPAFPENPQEMEQLKKELKDLEQQIGAVTSGLFAELDAQLGADASQFEEEALLRQHSAFKAELAMVEQTLQERRSRNVGEDKAAVEKLKERHQELDQKMTACVQRVDAEAEALQQQEEVLKAQEQAVSAARRELKEKQRRASEGERRLATLGAELKEVREARLQLLCQSVLEAQLTDRVHSQMMKNRRTFGKEIDLPFLGSKKDSKAALRRVAQVAGEPTTNELSLDVQLDFQQLPEESRSVVQLPQEAPRASCWRMSIEVNFDAWEAFDQLEQADQEAMVAEREAQRARKKMEAVERSFEEVRCQRRETFMECFHKVQEEIQEVYRRLTKSAAAGFEGGSAFLDLEDLEENRFLTHCCSLQDPWNGGIKFTAMPPSKRFCDMALLSGGEKTVAAMALLFAIQAYQRPPFLVLDEIDAHLDHTNVQALARFIDSLDCQAIVISQKDRFFTHGEGLLGVSKRQDTSVVFTMDLTRLRPPRPEKSDEGDALPLQ
eukprot:g17257.t1